MALAREQEGDCHGGRDALQSATKRIRFSVTFKERYEALILLMTTIISAIKALTYTLRNSDYACRFAHGRGVFRGDREPGRAH